MDDKIKFIPTKKSSYDGGKPNNKFLSDEAGVWPDPVNSISEIDRWIIKPKETKWNVHDYTYHYYWGII